MSGDLQETSRRSDKPRSILVLTTVANTMGFLLPYVRHFRERGWRVDGCARGITDYAPAAGVFDGMYELPLSRSIKDVRAIVASASSLDAVLRQGYDIVHVHTPIAAFVARALVRRMPSDARPKVAYTAHGFHFYKGGHPLTNAVFVTAERIAGRWTDRLIVINREDYDAARRYRIVPKRRLRYMPGIGVDTDWYSPDGVSPDAIRLGLEELGMDPARPYFVSIGELNRNKRPDDVIRALARMQEREPALLLLGEGPRRAEIEETATVVGVSNRVVMPGGVSDVRPLVAGAIALVQASRREGLPRSTMEALSLKVPVIASAARGQEELVGNDRGQLVPVGAIDRMAEAMDRMAHDPEGHAAMGERGRSLMVDRYDIRLLIEEHEQLYAELLGEVSALGPS